MKQAIVKDDDILKLIPQRPPIVMVDKFYGIEGDCSYSGLTITEDNIFTDNRVFTEPGIIEHIAQSAAARIGYIYTLNDRPVPLGFIGSVDKLQIYFLPGVGDDLYTEIRIIQEVGDITLAGAVVKNGDRIIVDCRMKIFLKQDESTQI